MSLENLKLFILKKIDFTHFDISIADYFKHQMTTSLIKN